MAELPPHGIDPTIAEYYSRVPEEDRLTQAVTIRYEWERGLRRKESAR